MSATVQKVLWLKSLRKNIPPKMLKVVRNKKHPEI
jgi:hypothetical protein